MLESDEHQLRLKKLSPLWDELESAGLESLDLDLDGRLQSCFAYTAGPS